MCLKHGDVFGGRDFQDIFAIWSIRAGKPVPLQGHPSIDLENIFNEIQIYLELKFLVPIFFISDKRQSCTKKKSIFCLSIVIYKL